MGTEWQAGMGRKAWLALCAWVALTPNLSANTSDLAQLNKQLGEDLVREKLRSVIVADFEDSRGQRSTLGWYVADELSENWLAKKEKFRVCDRSELQDVRVAREDLTPEMLHRLGSVWGVDAIITGEVERSAEQYKVTATIRKARDGSVAATESAAIAPSRLLDLMRPLSEYGSDVVRISHTGTNGLDVPRCVYCPIPSYSDRGRRAKAQGTILLSVLVSEDGRAEAIAVDKGMGFGLTQKAIKDVGKWRFKPATNKAGGAVRVIVPVEVTLRIN